MVFRLLISSQWQSAMLDFVSMDFVSGLLGRFSRLHHRKLLRRFFRGDLSCCSTQL
jgi:hypothetical protein